ncbi:MAG: response regulator transcription factor [Terriglobales bacterium]
MKLLIAEDDAFFRKILRQILFAEFEVIVAENGTQAWELLQENEWPLIAIIDWVMPGLSGPQICREARACTETANTYLILLTARNSPADIVAGLHAGADDYVTKPFEAEELCARVRLGRRIVELQMTAMAQSASLQEMRIRAKTAEANFDLASSRHRSSAGAAAVSRFSR